MDKHRIPQWGPIVITKAPIQGSNDLETDPYWGTGKGYLVLAFRVKKEKGKGKGNVY